MSENPAGDPVRLCLLTPGETLPAWAATAVERAIDETNAEVALVVRDASTSERSAPETLRRLVELREWGAVAAAMELFGDGLDAEEPRPIRGIKGLGNPEWVACEPITTQGWKNRLPDEVVDRMAETDVAVRFGFGFLVGDALSAPEHGVVSFHHGDLREYRGQPMGFWEFVEGESRAGVTLQRINETLDGGEIVAYRDVRIGDAPTWSDVRRRLFVASEGMLAEGIRNVRDEDFEPDRPSELGDLYTLPKGKPVLAYLAKTARGALRG